MNLFRMFRKDKQEVDILTLKTQQLEAVNNEVENAVSLVSSALNRMKLASQKMKNHMEDIDTYCANLMSVRKELDKNFTHNEAVIANFSKLLCMENDEN